MKYTILLISLLLTACAKPVIIPAELLANETLCMVEIAKVQISNNVASLTIKQNRQVYVDERNALVAAAITALSEANRPLAVSPFIPCTMTVQNFLRENGAIARSNNEITQKAIGAVQWVGGALVITEGVGDIVGAIAGGAGATTNISGSRVISGSGNGSTGSAFSASGEGLGNANTFADQGSAAQGGLLSRGTQAGGEANSETQSNSGSDEGVDTTPGVPVAEEPTTLPVEE